jgi:hypothetical protein
MQLFMSLFQIRRIYMEGVFGVGTDAPDVGDAIGDIEEKTPEILREPIALRDTYAVVNLVNQVLTGGIGPADQNQFEWPTK